MANKLCRWTLVSERLGTDWLRGRVRSATHGWRQPDEGRLGLAAIPVGGVGRRLVSRLDVHRWDVATSAAVRPRLVRHLAARQPQLHRLLCLDRPSAEPVRPVRLASVVPVGVRPSQQADTDGAVPTQPRLRDEHQRDAERWSTGAGLWRRTQDGLRSARSARAWTAHRSAVLAIGKLRPGRSRELAVWRRRRRIIGGQPAAAAAASQLVHVLRIVLPRLC